MFFTQEDYKKILNWLQRNSIKDTEFELASIPFGGEEIITLVQNGHNVKISLRNLMTQFNLIGASDFININYTFNVGPISMFDAIQLIPVKSRKVGLLVTFLNEDRDWKIYQFQGGSVNLWNVEEHWKDLIGELERLGFTADEENLTLGDDNVLRLKDRPYLEDGVSGMGKVYLRKNIVEVQDDNTGLESTINLLYEDLFNYPNTIYIIQYDFDLNGAYIQIPENSELCFDGGSINNGTILCDNTSIIPTFKGNANLEGTYIVRNFLPDNNTIIADSNNEIRVKEMSIGEEHLQRPLYTKIVNTENNVRNLMRDLVIPDEQTIVSLNGVIKVNESSITEDHLSEELHNKFNIIDNNFDTINNNIENILVEQVFADEEDITTEGRYLKFSDKEYVPALNSGLGRVYIRRNKPIHQLIVKPNTIYIILYDHNLNGGTLVIPENCVLLFEGGSLVNGDVILNQCSILSIHECFNNVSLSGKTASEPCADWFAGLDYEKILKCILTFHSCKLSSRTYNITQPIVVHGSFILRGNSLPDYYAGTTSPIGSSTRDIDDYSNTVLLFNNREVNSSTILRVEGGEERFGSFVISNVSFRVSDKFTRNIDGIEFTSVGGSNRPCIIEKCNFKFLNKAVYINPAGDSIGAGTRISFINNNICYCTHGIYADKFAALSGTITNNNIELCLISGIYAYKEDKRCLHANLVIENNNLESIPTPIVLSGGIANTVTIRGNYFERPQKQTVIIEGKDLNNSMKVVLSDNTSINNTVTWELKNLVLYSENNYIGSPNDSNTGGIIIGNSVGIYKNTPAMPFLKANSITLEYDTIFSEDIATLFYRSNFALDSCFDNVMYAKVNNKVFSKYLSDIQSIPSGDYTLSFAFKTDGLSEFFDITNQYINLTRGDKVIIPKVSYVKLNTSKMQIVNVCFTMQTDETFDGLNLLIRFLRDDAYITNIFIYLGHHKSLLLPKFELNTDGTLTSKVTIL